MGEYFQLLTNISILLLVSVGFSKRSKFTLINLNIPSRPDCICPLHACSANFYRSYLRLIVVYF